MASTRLSAYAHLLRAQMRSQAQYRASFAIDVAGSVAFGVLDVVTVFALFRVRPTLAGFTFPEVFLMTALASLAFALADLAAGNVERLRFYVRTGLFDAVLVRPLGALTQLLAMDVAARRVGRVVMCVALLATAAARAELELTPARLALLAVAPVAGARIFCAVFVATATVTFWWVESGELGTERLCHRLVVVDRGRIVHDGSLDALHARYASRRRVIADLDEPLAAPLSLPGLHVEVVEAEGRRITYALDGTGATAGDLVRRLSEVAALRDISVVEPDIEDVVARLYTGRAPRA